MTSGFPALMSLAASAYHLWIESAFSGDAAGTLVNRKNALMKKQRTKKLGRCQSKETLFNTVTGSMPGVWAGILVLLALIVGCTGEEEVVLGTAVNQISGDASDCVSDPNEANINSGCSLLCGDDFVCKVNCLSLLLDFDCYDLCGDDIEQTKSVLKQIGRGDLETAPDERFIRSFSRENQVNRLGRIIDQLTLIQ